MPTIYLSPSTQEANPFVTGNSEEYWMNLVADAMEPYLISSGIQFTRNTPEMTAASSIRASNAGDYDLHLAIHSNAAPADRAGTVRGSEVYYYPTSTEGRRAATIIANNLRNIYPGSVRALSNTYLGELRLTRAPSAFIELAYHDNVEDANWITSNIDSIAANIVLSLTEYFGIPFITPQAIRVGTVRTQGGALNIRSKPSTAAYVKTTVPNSSEVTIYSQYGNWYVIGYNGVVGYASADYIQPA